MKAKSDNLEKLYRIRLVLLIVAIIAMVLLVFVPKWLKKNSLQSPSRLVSKENYSGQERLGISLVKPMNLDEVPLDEILATRSEMLTRYPGLISSSEYKPTTYVFKSIDESLPWLSIERAFFVGPDLNVEIPKELARSAASKAILNPLLLAQAEFWGISQLGGTSALKWKSYQRLEGLQKKSVSFSPLESNLEYIPSQAKASVTYNLSEFSAQTSPYLEQAFVPQNLGVWLYLQNAMDLGFRYMSISQSANITGAPDPINIYPIDDFFTVLRPAFNNTIKLNFKSAPYKDLRSMVITNVPANLSLALWYEKPEADQPADFTFIVRFT